MKEKTEDGGGGSLYLDFLNGSKARIRPYTTGGYNEQWSRQIITATSPIGTTYIRVILYSSNNAQGIVYWDNVSLVQDENSQAPTAITEIESIEPIMQIYSDAMPSGSDSMLFLPLINK